MKQRPNAYKSRYQRYKQRPHVRIELSNKSDWTHINLINPAGRAKPR